MPGGRGHFVGGGRGHVHYDVHQCWCRIGLCWVEVFVCCMALSFEALENVFAIGNDYGELIGRMVLFLVGFVAWTALVVRAESNSFGVGHGCRAASKLL